MQANLSTLPNEAVLIITEKSQFVVLIKKRQFVAATVMEHVIPSAV